MAISNISFYHFNKIEDPEVLKSKLTELCQSKEILGTVLLAVEGINGMLAGSTESMLEIEKFFSEDTLFQGMLLKKSVSERIPFKKLLIKVKPQVLTLRNEDLPSDFKSGKYISPKELNASLKSGEDFLLLDTRNQFEIEMGTFRGAIDPGLKKFSDFPEYVKNNKDSLAGKKLITFCTGGIRCEKATAVLLKEGLTDIYQLHGGILEYFKLTDGDFFDGNCFVFDERVAVNKKLEEVL